MKCLLPGWKDVGLFALLSVVCAGLVLLGSQHDLILAGLSVPVFAAAALVGMHRTGRLRGPAPDKGVEQESEMVEVAAGEEGTP